MNTPFHFSSNFLNPFCSLRETHHSPYCFIYHIKAFDNTSLVLAQNIMTAYETMQDQLPFLKLHAKKKFMLLVCVHYSKLYAVTQQKPNTT